LKRFNSLLSSNGLLRSEIDNLRNERERYENISQKSENELRNLRAQLVECIERSVTSYEQRYDFSLLTLCTLFVKFLVKMQMPKQFFSKVGYKLIDKMFSYIPLKSF
jgi:hypothetical protein